MDLFMRAFVRRLGAVDFVNEAMLFGAGLLISVVPLLILLSAFASERVDDYIALHLGLDHHAASIVTHLFKDASPTVSAATVTSLLFVAAGTFAVVSSLLQIYEKVFDQPHRGRRDFLRIVAWAVAMSAAVALASVLSKAVIGVHYGVALVEVAAFSSLTLFVWWTMHFLLGGRVEWNTLRPLAPKTVEGVAGSV